MDFQTRANEFYCEAIKRVQYGDIGGLVCGEAGYQTGRLGIKEKPGTVEARLRNWVFDKALSGDIITEQNIHAIDVACWILDGRPISAYGIGGRKSRTDVGDCWDHFAVVFRFEKDVVVSFSSKQFGKGYDDILCRMYGRRGTIDTHYGGQVSIRGSSPYKGGITAGIYQKGAVKNISDFYNSIKPGKFSNTTVAESVRSNLATIVGRTAAYRQQEVTWQGVIDAGEKIEANLKGLKA